ncbi:putative alpha/beta hydrolase [Paenibacillus sp. 598K]|nr:hypothetical protein [Paenibacillus sp. 598K]GBF77173.1 putative alpha/beta hydrolase [Paenibacillus sp. 598K]
MVSHLVLCNTDAFEVFPPSAFASLQIGVRVPGFLSLMAMLFRVPSFVRSPRALGLLSHAATKEELSELYVRPFTRSRSIRRDFAKVVRSWDPAITQETASRLARYDKPALILWGADDQQLFPRSLTYVQEDQPEAFAAALTQFLLQADASGTTIDRFAREC